MPIHGMPTMPGDAAVTFAAKKKAGKAAQLPGMPKKKGPGATGTGNPASINAIKSKMPTPGQKYGRKKK